MSAGAKSLSQVRLVGGPASREGRLEALLYDGSWAVVDAGWETYFANANQVPAVACRQLGFGGGQWRGSSELYGRGKLPVRVKALQCTGTEASRSQCELGHYRNDFSDYRANAVGIACSGAWHASGWHCRRCLCWLPGEALCGRAATGAAGSRVHGLQGRDASRQASKQPQMAPCWRAAVPYTQSPPLLTSYQRIACLLHHCFALALPAGSRTITAMRLMKGSKPSTDGQGRLEVDIAGKGWAAVCRLNVAQQAAAAACRQLGFAGGSQPAYNSNYSPPKGVLPTRFGNTTLPIFLNSLACPGKRPASLEDCDLGFQNKWCKSPDFLELSCR